MDDLAGEGEIVTGEVLGQVVEVLTGQGLQKGLDVVVKEPLFADEQVEAFPMHGDEVQTQQPGHGPDAGAAVGASGEDLQAHVQVTLGFVPIAWDVMGVDVVLVKAAVEPQPGPCAQGTVDDADVP